MKRVLLVLTLACASAPVAAQVQQGSTARWPAYTDQQRWQRASFHAVTFSVGAINYAKSVGKTPEDVGRHIGDVFALGWGSRESGVPIRVARGMLFNMAAFPGTEAHISAATDTSATIRYRRTYYTSIIPDTANTLGVTASEYERFFAVVNQRIAAHLGVRADWRKDGEWATLTFSGMGSSAITAFPRSGTFTHTLTAEQAGGAANAGAWTLSFTPDGRYAFRNAAGEASVSGRYTVQLDQMTVGEESGPIACTQFPSGTYRFTPQANGDIVFGRLDETCEGRARFFARRWVKK